MLNLSYTEGVNNHCIEGKLKHFIKLFTVYCPHFLMKNWKKERAAHSKSFINCYYFSQNYWRDTLEKHLAVGKKILNATSDSFEEFCHFII